MPKIITARHREVEVERARQYTKARVMMPTIPLAMVTLLTGYGSLAVMWFQDTLTPQALLRGTFLFVLGAVLGWMHTRYERYLVANHPEYLARKHKVLEAAKDYKRPKRDILAGGLEHPGRQWVVVAYLIGIALMLGLSVAFVEQVGIYPAFFLPWAGYFNAKVVFWRDLFAAS